MHDLSERYIISMVRCGIRSKRRTTLSGVVNNALPDTEGSVRQNYKKMSGMIPIADILFWLICSVQQGTHCLFIPGTHDILYT